MITQRSIVVVAPNWLGDAVMSLPVVGFLSAVHGLILRIVASPYSARVYMGVDGVTDLSVLDRSGPGRGVAARATAIRRMDVDGGLVLPPSFSSALTMYLSGVPHRVGFGHDGRGFLLNHSVASGGLRDEHLSENYLRLGRALVARLGLEPPDAPATPPIQVFDRDRDALRAILAAKSAPATGYAVVVPGATYGPTKHWPHDKYRRMIAALGKDMPVILSGGPAEKGLCRSIATGQDNVFEIAGETSLGELFALLEGASVVIANDSGAPHAAAALGVPVVVIFGSTSPLWTRPRGDNVRVVQEPVHCSPCFLKKCPTHLECYQGINPERVLGKVYEAMGNGETAVSR